MQEKDMKKQLNQELSEVAPDILQKILAEPRVPIKDEKELLGSQRVLFKEKKRVHPYAWASAVAAVVALVVVVTALIQFFGHSIGEQNSMLNNQIAYSIFVDVNPSIEINVGTDGRVLAVKAGNKDAKKIVESINEKISEDASYDEVMEQVVKKLNKNYLKKKDSAMLVSVASEDAESIKGKTTEIKEVTDKIKKENKVQCKTLYQKCVITEEVQSVAKDNKVSVGKAALCIKLAETEKSSVEKLCKEKISSLVKEIEKSGVLDSSEFDEDEVFEQGLESVEIEETTVEIETDSIEYVEESTEETESESLEESFDDPESFSDDEEIGQTEPMADPVNES